MPPGPVPARPMPRSHSRLSHLRARLSSFRYGSNKSRQRWLCSWNYDQLEPIWEEWRWRYLQPLLFIFCKHILLHHSGLNGHASKTFEAEPNVSVKCSFRLHTLDYKGRLDTHSPFSLQIYDCEISRETEKKCDDITLTETRLVSDDVSWYERDRTAERLRAFMHIQEWAKPMSSAVLKEILSHMSRKQTWEKTNHII